MTALVHRRAARWIIDNLVDDGADGGDVNECRTRRLSWPIVKQRRREASDVGEWNEQCRLCYRYETESSTTGNHRHATRSVTLLLLLLRFLPLDRQGYPSTTGGWPRNPVRNSTTSNSTIFVVVLFFFFIFFFLPTVFCVECACLCLRSRTLDFWLLDIASASVRGPLCGSFPAPNRLPISLPTLVRLVQVRWNETPSKPRVSLSHYTRTQERTWQWLITLRYNTSDDDWLSFFFFFLAGENASLL